MDLEELECLMAAALLAGTANYVGLAKKTRFERAIQDAKELRAMSRADKHREAFGE